MYESVSALWSRFAARCLSHHFPLLHHLHGVSDPIFGSLLIPCVLVTSREPVSTLIDSKYDLVVHSSEEHAIALVPALVAPSDGTQSTEISSTHAMDAIDNVSDEMFVCYLVWKTCHLQCDDPLHSSWSLPPSLCPSTNLSS